MINWLSRVDPSRDFLKTSDQVWTYGETIREVNYRMTNAPTALTPRLDSKSVFDVLAGIFGGGVHVSRRSKRDGDLEMAGSSLAVFTSGTSGSPKGVRLTATNLEAACRASMDHLGHGSGDTWLTAMPMHHVGGLSALLRSVYAGGSARLLPKFEPGSFVAAMRGDVTMVSVVPTMLHRLLDHDDGPYRGLRAVLVGGGPIPKGLLERASDAGLPVLPSYGMTETFGQVATLRPGSSLGCHAHPLPGVEVRIESDGRIALRSDQISPGYLGEPDRDDPWFVTNDLGQVDNEGAIEVLGRADVVIVTGGENVDPLRVEAELLEHDGVDESVVVGLPHSVWGSLLICLYAGSGDHSDLEEWLRNRVDGFMIPKRWVKVDALPRTDLGKIDRVAALSVASDS